MQSNLSFDDAQGGSGAPVHNPQVDVTTQSDTVPHSDIAQHQNPEQALGNMRNTAYVLSEMLEHAVCEVRRLQKQDEAALGRCFENKEELVKSYDTKSMKELTAILKDVVAVEKALCESSAEQEAAAATGVVLLPPVATVQAEHNT